MLKRFLPFATLFLSLSTLVCCALPALFVVLGMGATFVGIFGVFPQLIWISEHKVAVFTAAGVCLGISAVMRMTVSEECPVDPALAAECQKARGVSSVIFIVSVIAYFVGGFFAFVAPLLQ